MARRTKFWTAVVIASGMVAIPWMASFAEEPVPPAAEKQSINEPANNEPAKRPAPAPLADYTKKGLAYLAGQQNKDGGWGQGGGWRTGGNGRVEGENVKDPSDMGNTCVAVLALIRSGSSPTAGPTQGEYTTQVSKGIDFICEHVEQADRQSIWVTDVRDTQLQSKIGQYVDTFLAALVLSELKGKVPADKGGSRIEASLKKVIAKIEANQKEDGTFAGNAGWASVLSQGLCSKALNRAVQNGVQVKGEVLKRDFEQAGGQLAAAGAIKGGDFAAKPAEPVTGPGPGVVATSKPAGIGGGVSGLVPGAEVRISGGVAAGDAGVRLYNFSANGSRIQELKKSQEKSRREAQRVLENEEASADDKAKATESLKEFDRVATAHKEVTDELIKQLDDERFIAGFGNNGGEEFLSHMNISENLCAEGGKEWQRWNKSISTVIGKVQNGDGSWSGHHCITGRTFCTSAALLTLMADRAPAPVAADEAGKGEKLSDAKK